MTKKFITLQLRYRTINPWPKLYATTEENAESVLRGLPCALIIHFDDMAPTWHTTMQTQVVEAGGVRAMKRGDCHDRFTHPTNERLHVLDMVEETLGVKWEDVVFLVPIFQRHLKWKVSDLPEKLNSSPLATQMAWIKDRHAIHADRTLSKSGPPMKLPSGTVIGSCCGACPYNFQNMLGQCSFGGDTCRERMDFPGKSMMVRNLRQWVDHREVMAHKDTQPDLPAFGHGDLKDVS